MNLNRLETSGIVAHTSYWGHDGSDERQDRVDDGDLFDVETHLDHLKRHVRQVQRHSWNI